MEPLVVLFHYSRAINPDEALFFAALGGIMLFLNRMANPASKEGSSAWWILAVALLLLGWLAVRYFLKQ